MHFNKTFSGCIGQKSILKGVVPFKGKTNLANQFAQPRIRAFFCSSGVKTIE